MCILHFSENFTERKKEGYGREVRDGERSEGVRKRRWRKEKGREKKIGRDRGMEKGGGGGGSYFLEQQM